MGIYGFRFVYHGDWADPEIVWHGHAMNKCEVEDPMWEIYHEDCKENGNEPNEDGFVRFCKDNVETMREYAQMAIDCGKAYRVKRIRWSQLLFSSNAPELIAVPAR